MNYKYTEISNRYKWRVTWKLIIVIGPLLKNETFVNTNGQHNRSDGFFFSLIFHCKRNVIIKTLLS